MTASTVHADVVRDKIDEFVVQHKLPDSYKAIALNWFAPLANSIALHHQRANSTLVVGINGCQGSGKSTLTSLLVSILNSVFNLQTIGFSIDDFYYSKQQRQLLAENIHPLLATRGAPGTHDINLLDKVLSDLKSGESCAIPVFDKSIDDLLPLQKWNMVESHIDIVILEGWCVGIEAQKSADLVLPVNELERLKDPNGKWREYVNDRLSTDYQKVFMQIDYLLMMKAPSFEQVYNWRWQQEQKLANSIKNKNLGDKPLALMNKQQVSEFIQYYQRLTTHALKTLPPKCNTVYSLNEKRGIETCEHH